MWHWMHSIALSVLQQDRSNAWVLWERATLGSETWFGGAGSVGKSGNLGIWESEDLEIWRSGHLDIQTFVINHIKKNNNTNPQIQNLCRPTFRKGLD